MTASKHRNPIRLLAFVLASAVLVAGGTARANPQGGTVVAGDAAIMQAGPGELIINQIRDN